MPVPQLLLLGPLQLCTPDGKIFDSWPTRKAGGLFTYLTQASAPSLSREAVGERLWPDTDPQTARNRLKQTTALLRRSLSPYFPFPEAEARHLLPRLSLETDAAVFARAMRRAERATDQNLRLQLLEEALALWRGSFLTGWESEWIAKERSAWNVRYVSTSLAAAQAYQFQERYEEALARAHAARAIDPLDERATETILRLLIRMDRRATALRLYREYETLIRTEFAEAPSPELQNLVLGSLLPVRPRSSHPFDKMQAIPVNQEIDDTARLLGVLRQAGILQTGAQDQRPDLLHALSQVSSSLTGPERDALRRQETNRVVQQVQTAVPHLRGPQSGRYLESLDQSASGIAAALHYLGETRPTEALRLATSLHWWWYTRGRYAEGRPYLDTLLGNLPAEKSKERAEALLAAGHFANCSGDNRAAFARYQEARKIATALGDSDTVALSLMREGNAAMEEGLLHPAYQLCHEATAYFRDRNDDPNLLTTIYTLKATVNILAFRGSNESAAVVWGIVNGLRRRFGHPQTKFEEAHPELHYLPEALPLCQPGVRRAAKAQGDALSISLTEALQFVQQTLI